MSLKSDRLEILFTLKAPRKNTSENVVCWSRLLKKLPNITDKLSIEANSVDPEQTDLGPHCLL